MRWLALCVALLAACSAEPAFIVSHTVPEDTRDPTGPYVVQVELRGALGDDRLIVCWARGDEAAFQAQPTRARPGRDDLRFAELPGQPAGTTVRFHVAVVDLAEACPVSGDLHEFRVLGATLGCDFDSDCLTGVEICASGTCRAYSGTCEGDGACPGGYACDDTLMPPTCVIPARVCTSDLECPVLELCDLDRGECIARP